MRAGRPRARSPHGSDFAPPKRRRRKNARRTRALSDRRASSKPRAKPNASAGGKRRRAIQKVTADHPHLSHRHRQGGVLGGSRRWLPPRAAARSAAVGSNGGVCVGIANAHKTPPTLDKTREGFRGRRKTPPRPQPAQTTACRTPTRSNQNHRLSRWYAPRLQGDDAGNPTRALKNSPTATISQAAA